ncbi:MAG: hypothetical protein GPJ01_22510 [Microcystis aeruginosa LL13-06]|nr:hypothetical protein [Microcystis aeruginosa LL13-06]
MRNLARERSRNLNREVWESPSVYGGEDVKTRMAAQMVASQGVTVPITDPENFIAELIHNDFLSVVDSIDG